MKYIIQGTYGSLRYWAKIGDNYGEDYFTWQGLKDNATVFTKNWEANEKLSTIWKASPRLTIEIIEHHGTNNTTPDAEEKMV